MANSISNRTFPIAVRVPFVRFCQSIRANVTILTTEDGAAFRVSCASNDYPFIVDAADAIEASQAAEAGWLAEYLANPRMKPCAVGTFSEPLSRRLDEVARDHWHNSGRAERVREEWEAVTREVKRTRTAKGRRSFAIKNGRHDSQSVAVAA
ncbi:MAG: hypothetical protein C0519_01335 [Hyphomicrobium sp.]|nr:hypothetical protein [Hyphomicrobium sp.]PPD09560.1 MAG: hypothetical protein CTY28_01770 [Hyphomicrobium sp.]